MRHSRHRIEVAFSAGHAIVVVSEPLLVGRGDGLVAYWSGCGMVTGKERLRPDADGFLRAEGGLAGGMGFLDAHEVRNVAVHAIDVRG